VQQYCDDILSTAEAYSEGGNSGIASRAWQTLAKRDCVSGSPSLIVGTFQAVINFIINAFGQLERNAIMSDPYHDDRSRRYGVQAPNGQSSSQTGFWPWLTSALTALGLLIGGFIGYNWGWGAHEKFAQSSPPATTGSAPSHQRPAPETR
jgi:hypothetical protein